LQFKTESCQTEEH